LTRLRRYAIILTMPTPKNTLAHTNWGAIEKGGRYKQEVESLPAAVRAVVAREIAEAISNSWPCTRRRPAMEGEATRGCGVVVATDVKKKGDVQQCWEPTTEVRYWISYGMHMGRVNGMFMGRQYFCADCAKHGWGASVHHEITTEEETKQAVAGPARKS
jgi:hypothetical protein